MSMDTAVAVIMPCFNENRTVIEFLESLDASLTGADYHFKIIVVDDASVDNTLELLKAYRFHADNLELIVLTLRFNLGHQGAIYQGLLFAETLQVNRFIVMDSDGEDDPDAIPALLERTEADIVHVVRGRRSEGLLFRLLYGVYKILFRIITGKTMNFGNYCMINRKVLEVLLHTSFIHFPAHLLKQRVKRSSIVVDRKQRLHGKSKMNLSGLVYHAVRSLVEFAEDLLMVFLKLFILIAIAISGVLGYVLYQKLFTDKAILGWASTLTTGLFNTAIICLGFFVIGVLLLNILSKRNGHDSKALYKKVR